MKSENLNVKELKINKKNPRTITDENFYKLVNSILVLPKMLELRPIVVDDKLTVIGGNMRTRALQYLSGLDEGKIIEKLVSSIGYDKKKKNEKTELQEYWKNWVKNPVCAVVKASNLTEAEEKEFIIKDNSEFGKWDWDMLANEWDAKELKEWGVDVWQLPSFGSDAGAGKDVTEDNNPNIIKSANGEQNDELEEILPTELQGVDLEPDELPKLKGDDECAMERIILVYKKEDAVKVAKLLGIEAVNKVIYNLDEILG